MPSLRSSAITLHRRTPLERRFRARSALARGGARLPRRPDPVGPFTVRPGAQPPAAKFERLLRADWRFRRSWERAGRTARCITPAAHERTLALAAAKAGWSDQEIADLVTAARRRHGDGSAAAESGRAGREIGDLLAWTHEQVARERALREVSAEFAGVFLGQFLRAMRRTVPVPREGFGFGGREEQTFRELLDDEFATRIARGENYGLTDLIYRSLARADGRAEAAIVPSPAASAAAYRATAARTAVPAKEEP